MRAIIYIILLILIYGYIAGYFLKNHQNYQYLESEVAAFNFRYISMIILNGESAKCKGFKISS